MCEANSRSFHFAGPTTTRYRGASSTPKLCEISALMKSYGASVRGNVPAIPWTPNSSAPPPLSLCPTVLRPGHTSSHLTRLFAVAQSSLLWRPKGSTTSPYLLWTCQHGVNSCGLLPWTFSPSSSRHSLESTMFSAPRGSSSGSFTHGSTCSCRSVALASQRSNW